VRSISRATRSDSSNDDGNVAVSAVGFACGSRFAGAPGVDGAGRFTERAVLPVGGPALPGVRPEADGAGVGWIAARSPAGPPAAAGGSAPTLAPLSGDADACVAVRSSGTGFSPGAGGVAAFEESPGAGSETAAGDVAAAAAFKEPADGAPAGSEPRLPASDGSSSAHAEIAGHANTQQTATAASQRRRLRPAARALDPEKQSLNSSTGVMSVNGSS
jgi:hypothetical protein